MAYGIAAYALWGLFPLFWPLLEPAGALEVLAHRVLWSLLVVAALLALGVASVRGLRRGQVVRLAIAAVLLAVNWGTYIYGVNSERVVETSLGYFINPLVTVLLGVLVLRERLRTTQWVAIGIGAAAVGVLTVDYGHVPYLALGLAASFGLYGLIKKRVGIRATDGLLVESGVLAAPAVVFVAQLSARGEANFGHVSIGHTLLVVGSGAMTAIPLLFFAGSANRIPLSTIGLLQYLAPVIQLLIGVAIYHEPMPPGRLAGFALVWLALTLFTWDGIRQARSRSRLSAAAQPVAANV
jgi:chloramphenicol-sensitive protein RarD